MLKRLETDSRERCTTIALTIFEKFKERNRAYRTIRVGQIAGKKMTPYLDFGQSSGVTECINQASLKGLRGFWRLVRMPGCE